MIKEAATLQIKELEKRFDGKGKFTSKALMGEDEFRGKGRMLAHNTIPPGASIGFHKHETDFEVYYILRGEGLVDDNGVMKPVKVGDVIYTPPGESHSIENTGSENLEFIALILFA